jgi:hypothetical protein
MDEAEWLGCTDPEKMLDFLRGKASDRKLRLFAVACCRRLWTMMIEGNQGSLARAAVEATERFADGACSEEELQAAQAGALKEAIEWEEWVPYESADRCNLEAAWAAVAVTQGGVIEAAARAQEAARLAPWDMPEAEKAGWGPPWALHQDTARASERLVQANLLRCIFGNPFHPVMLNSTCRTAAVTSLAQAAYEERELPGGNLAPDRLAVLADALEEAGCTDQAILDHLRGPGPHIRGCWVLDAILGRE